MSTNTSYSDSTLIDGRKTVTSAGTAVAIGSGVQPVSSVAITAETDNTGYVVVGASDVVAATATRKGTPLNPGDTIVLDNVRLDQVYIDSIVSTDGVTYIATSK